MLVVCVFCVLSLVLPLSVLLVFCVCVYFWCVWLVLLWSTMITHTHKYVKSHKWLTLFRGRKHSWIEQNRLFFPFRLLLFFFLFSLCIYIFLCARLPCILLLLLCVFMFGTFFFAIILWHISMFPVQCFSLIKSWFDVNYTRLVLLPQIILSLHLAFIMIIFSLSFSFTGSPMLAISRLLLY